MASRAANSMRDRVMKMWEDAGVDPTDVLTALAAERDVIGRELARTGGRYGPVSGFIIPTLRALGLYGERTAGLFKQMWTETQGREAAERYASSKAELPEDLEAWVNEGYEALAGPPREFRLDHRTSVRAVRALAAAEDAFVSALERAPDYDEAGFERFLTRHQLLDWVAPALAAGARST